MKLAATQLVLLSAAAQRQDGAIELGPKLKGNASRLLSEQLIEEVLAQGSLPEWRRLNLRLRMSAVSGFGGLAMRCCLQPPR